MRRSKNILIGLVGFLCTLNFTGFAQDTVAVFEEPSSVVWRESRSDIQDFKTLPKTKTKPFALPKEKNPKVATWLSVALPGAGQVYNGHWYKVPVIYGGAGVLWYMHSLNVKERNIFQIEYRGRISGDSILNLDLARYSNDQILSIRNYYQRNIELIYIFSGLLYILNIVDACVFAHLSTFDVSDNLSLRIQPYASPDLTPYTANQLLPMKGGLRLTFTLK